MIYERGNHYNYDEWATRGCEGWSYDEVLPYFMKSEGNKIKDLENSGKASFQYIFIYNSEINFIQLFFLKYYI